MINKNHFFWKIAIICKINQNREVLTIMVIIMCARRSNRFSRATKAETSPGGDLQYRDSHDGAYLFTKNVCTTREIFMSNNRLSRSTINQQQSLLFTFQNIGSWSVVLFHFAVVLLGLIACIGLDRGLRISFILILLFIWRWVKKLSRINHNLRPVAKRFSALNQRTLNQR